MERALLQPIRKINRPEFEITYRGKVYASKNELYRELGIAGDCIHEMMTNHDTDFETAVDIYWEIKLKAGIPAEEMLSYGVFVNHGFEMQEVYNGKTFPPFVASDETVAIVELQNKAGDTEYKAEFLTQPRVVIPAADCKFI